MTECIDLGTHSRRLQELDGLARSSPNTQPWQRQEEEVFLGKYGLTAGGVVRTEDGEAEASCFSWKARQYALCGWFLSLVNTLDLAALFSSFESSRPSTVARGEKGWRGRRQQGRWSPLPPMASRPSRGGGDRGGLAGGWCTG
jgi:hypothetical protein